MFKNEWFKMLNYTYTMRNPFNFLSYLKVPINKGWTTETFSSEFYKISVITTVQIIYYFSSGSNVFYFIKILRYLPWHVGVVASSVPSGQWLILSHTRSLEMQCAIVWHLNSLQLWTGTVNRRKKQVNENLLNFVE